MLGNVLKYKEYYAEVKFDTSADSFHGFQCTPLVKFPLKDFKDSESVRGTTLAELGNRNRPLDMIVYEQDGKDYLLLTNSVRGVMKISTDDIERSEGITERIGGTAGQTYETIADLKGVEQMDRLNATHALVIAKSDVDWQWQQYNIRTQAERNVDHGDDAQDHFEPDRFFDIRLDRDDPCSPRKALDVPTS